MTQQVWKKGRIMLAGLFGIAMLTLVGLWGCGTSGYDQPSAPAAAATRTDTALVNAATVKGWLDAGLVNKPGNTERVVILEVSTTTNYAAGHIPGAINVNLTGELMATRIEGPAEFGQMVATGAQMDELIQRCGIDENTTIVFTTSEAEMNSNTLWNMARGYTTFRYWGFPKERLKVLDGGNKAWKSATLPMSTIVPTITRSTYSVTPRNINRVQTNVRASLSDMIAAVRAGNALFIDGRSDGVPASTTDLLETGNVVFEGAVLGGNGYAYGNVVDATTKTFKSADVIKAELAAKGIDLTKSTIYTLCRAGNIASVLFFVFDGYLYNDGSKNIVWYDGSWGQWGLMSDNAAKGGKLPAGSAWATDSLTTPITYNADVPRPVVDITYRLKPVSHADTTANQIEDADKAYLSPITTSTGGSASGGGGGC